MPRLAAAHLIVSLLFLCLGVDMGIYMGINKDFTLAPVHAHINLLGWVTNALFASVFWHAGRRADRLGWSIFACLNFGVALKNIGLASLLLGGHLQGVLLGGVLLICAGVLMFFGFVVREAARE